MLGFFKYFNFFVDNVHAVLAALGLHAHLPVLRVILPVGISFYTFQAMSYTIDVYRGELRARRSLLDVAVFISFFPHLVAGPDPARVVPAAAGRAGRGAFSLAAGVAAASCLMCWGFFKKLVIADNVGVIANKVFALSDPSFEMLWAGVFAFAIQIYADFSAYTDIARGTSRWLGLRADRELRSSLPGAHARRTSGGAGTSRCRPGSATTSTSRSAARARRGGSGRATCWSRSCSRGCGTARAGTTCCGGSITACCW